MSKLKPPVNSEDHQLGNPETPITLVEYGDFECPHCGLAHPLLQRLLREMNTRLHFVFRYFPLSEIHPHAFMAATAAEAAGKQGKFWQMHDKIFEHQDRLSTAFLLALAKCTQLDEKQFNNDWQSEATKRKVERDFESGVRSGVNGTPTFFLNDRQIFDYDETYESLADAVQREMELKGV